MGNTYGNITVRVSSEIFEKKNKALFILREKQSNLSREVAKIIEKYADEYDKREKREEV